MSQPSYAAHFHRLWGIAQHTVIVSRASPLPSPPPLFRSRLKSSVRFIEVDETMVDSMVDACIQNLSKEAKKYFELVSSNDADGVLWAVFTAPQNPQSGAAPQLKRYSFLPLSTVQSSKAQSLIQMYNTCNHKSQFVCWFTLEDFSGKPLASKVMIVDAGRSELGIAAKRFTDPSAWHNSHENQALEELKEDMMSFQRQRMGGGGGGGGGTSPRVGATSTSMNEERLSYMSQLNHTNSFARNPTSTASKLAQGGGTPIEIATANQYQQILKVCLQVADSVAKMGTAIDELQSRVDSLQKQAKENPPPSEDLMDRILSRLEAVEQRLDAQEARIQSFDSIQQSFFDQMNALRKQIGGPVMASTFASTPQPVAGNTSSSAAGRYAASVSSPAAKQDSQSQRPPSPIRSSGAGAATVIGSTVIGEDRSVSTESLFGKKASASSKTSESLSDMLKQMENRLSRIKTPK
jgi:hypothetical protein